MRTKFAVALMQLSATTGLSFYRIAELSGIPGPTISKWLAPMTHKHHRNPTEEQVLRVFFALTSPCSWSTRTRDLLYAPDAEYLAALDDLRGASQLAWPDLGERSSVGAERLAEFLAGATVPPAARLRLLAVVVFAPSQIALANRLLQSGGFYVLQLLPALEKSRRTA